MIKVIAITADIHHVVDGAAAPKHSSARPLDLSMVEMWLIFGSIVPIYSCMDQCEGIRGIMDLRHRIIVATGFEQENRGGRIFGQPMRQHTTCGASSHNN